MRYPFVSIHIAADRRVAKNILRLLDRRGVEARIDKRWVVQVHPDDAEHARSLLASEREYDGPEAA